MICPYCGRNLIKLALAALYARTPRGKRRATIQRRLKEQTR